MNDLSLLASTSSPPIALGDRDLILENVGHLGAALIQAVPTDDPIIIEHIRSAHRIALEVYRDSPERMQHGPAR